MAARVKRSVPALLPAGAAVALFVFWMADEGGYAPHRWYVGVFVVAGLLVATLFGLGQRIPRPSRAGAVALAALAAYTAWSFVSITWADADGLALEGANRTLLFLLAYMLFALLPWRDVGALFLLSGFTVAVAAIGAVTTLKLGLTDDPGRLFIDARLASPAGYQNADAAMWTMGALPALVLASRRELPFPLRALLLAAAGMLVELGVLAQSRGWLIALPVLLAIAFVVVPGRLRLAAASVLVAAAVVPALPALLDVYDAGGFEAPQDAAHAIGAEAPGAAGAILVTSLALAVGGALLCLADRRLSPSRALVRGTERAVAALAIVAALGGAGAALAAVDGDPAGRIERAWDDFSDPGGGDNPANANRFGSLGTDRYDFWRVAVDVSLDHPLIGAGQDNYAAEYLARRRTFDEPRWVHSLPLRLTTHTGLIGLALFGTFVVAVVLAALGRRSGAGDRVLAGALLLPFAVWLVHGSVDWLWEFPGLSAPALGLAGAAAALGGGRAAEPLWRIPRWAPAAAAVLVAACAIAAAGRPLLAERQIERALDGWQSDPAEALQRLEDAAELNPLATRADLTAGLIAGRVRAPRESERRFARAAERDATSWFALLEVGLAASARGDEDGARSRLLAARALNPREPVIRTALSRLATDRPLTAREAEQRLLERALRRVGRTRP